MADDLIAIPRNTGFDADGVAQSEADHHLKCPGCGRWFDIRYLGQVFEHIRDGEEPSIFKAVD
jgi:CRISPR/Cas system type I-B associated protein Csh2 (Cas7 group RAMP superfamily)